MLMMRTANSSRGGGGGGWLRKWLGACLLLVVVVALIMCIQMALLPGSAGRDGAGPAGTTTTRQPGAAAGDPPAACVCPPVGAGTGPAVAAAEDKDMVAERCAVWLTERGGKGEDPAVATQLREEIRVLRTALDEAAEAKQCGGDGDGEGEGDYGRNRHHFNTTAEVYADVYGWVPPAMTEAERRCDRDYGFGLVDKIKSSRSVRYAPAANLGSSMWCYAASKNENGGPYSFCEMRRFGIQVSKVQAGLKSGWAGEEGHLTYHSGALIAGAARAKDSASYTSAAGQVVYGELLSSLKVSDAPLLLDSEDEKTLKSSGFSTSSSTKCSHTFRGTTLAITRYEWAHMLFSVCEMVNAFIVQSAVYGVDEDSHERVRILFLDTHPPGPYADLFAALSPAGSVLYWTQDIVPLGDTVCFERLVTSVPGYNSFLVQHANSPATSCHDTELMRALRRQLVSHVGALDLPTPSPVSILMISRRPYNKAGFNKGKVNRAIPNENGLKDAVVSKARDKGISITFDIVDLASLSITEQVTKVASSSILIGAHGAGMVHSIFLPVDTGSAVVEIFPSGMGENNRNRNIARHLGRAYFSMEAPVQGSSEQLVPDVNTFVEELEAVIHLARSSFSTSAYRCGYQSC